MNMLRAFAFLTAFSFLSACAAVSTDTPIGISGGRQMDAQLLGGWKIVQLGNQTEEHAYVFFLPLKDGSVQALAAGWDMMNGAPEKKDGSWVTYDIVLGKAGEYRFINARPLLEDGKPPQPAPDSAYVPLLYRQESNGTVTIFTIIENQTVRDAVQSGRLKGTVSSGQSVHLTSDANALDEFFATEAPKLFTEPMGSLQPLN